MTTHYGAGPDGSFDEHARAERSLVRAPPLGRVGTPEAVAHTVLFLASDARPSPLAGSCAPMVASRCPGRNDRRGRGISGRPEWLPPDGRRPEDRRADGREPGPGTECSGIRLRPQPPAATTPATGPACAGCRASRSTAHHHTALSAAPAVQRAQRRGPGTRIFWSTPMAASFGTPEVAAGSPAGGFPYTRCDPR